jgi:hypothetical protein
MKNTFLKKAVYEFCGIFYNKKFEQLLYLFKSASQFRNADVKFYLDRFDYFNNLKNFIYDDIVLYLEFGVYKGDSMNYFRANLNSKSTCVGFDTFTGLPEEWNSNPKGKFDVDGNIPSIDNVLWKQGLFQDTLPPFIRENSVGLKHKLIIHLDADLYSSTSFILYNLYPYLKSGDIILFDEYFSFRNGNHEFKAFHDFLETYHIKYEPLAKTLEQFAIRIL